MFNLSQRGQILVLVMWRIGTELHAVQDGANIRSETCNATNQFQVSLWCHEMDTSPDASRGAWLCSPNSKGRTLRKSKQYSCYWTSFLSVCHSRKYLQDTILFIFILVWYAITKINRASSKDVLLLCIDCLLRFIVTSPSCKLDCNVIFYKLMHC